MKHKKGLIFGLLMVFMALFMSGCSSAEWGFYSLEKEIAHLKIYEQTGEISFDINQLPADVSDNMTSEDFVLQQMLANMKLVYDLKVDDNNQVMSFVVSLVNKNDGTSNEIISLISKEDMAYIKLTGLIQQLNMSNDPELSAIFDQLSKEETQYLSISREEMNEIFSATPGMNPAQVMALYDSSYKEKQIDLYERILDDLMTDVYDQYQTGVISQSGQKYTITLDADSLVKLYKSFMVYSVNNIDPIGEFLTDTVTNMTDEEMELLGMDPADRANMLISIDAMVAEVKQNAAQILSEMDQIEAEMKASMTGMEDSKLVLSIEKTGTGKYEGSSLLRIKYNPTGITEDAMDLAVSIKTATNTVSSFDVEVPEGNLMTLTELIAKLPSIIEIETTFDLYSYNHGFDNRYGDIEVKNIEGSVYLPMRQVGELFQENIGWDQTLKKAYVVKDGARIYLTGIVFEGRTFIKIREFEKLGYRVDWNGEYKTVTIVK